MASGLTGMAAGNAPNERMVMFWNIPAHCRCVGVTLVTVYGVVNGTTTT